MNEPGSHIHRRQIGDNGKQCLKDDACIGYGEGTADYQYGNNEPHSNWGEPIVPKPPPPEEEIEYKPRSNNPHHTIENKDELHEHDGLRPHSHKHWSHHELIDSREDFCDFSNPNFVHREHDGSCEIPDSNPPPTPPVNTGISGNPAPPINNEQRPPVVPVTPVETVETVVPSVPSVPSVPNVPNTDNPPDTGISGDSVRPNDPIPNTGNQNTGQSSQTRILVESTLPPPALPPFVEGTIDLILGLPQINESEQASLIGRSPKKKADCLLSARTCRPSMDYRYRLQ